MPSMHAMPTGANRPRSLPLAVWGNPLARRTDRLEATIVIALTVLWSHPAHFRGRRLGSVVNRFDGGRATASRPNPYHR